MTDPVLNKRFIDAARCAYGDDNLLIADDACVEPDVRRDGAWVQAKVFVSINDVEDAAFGPTYCVWIAEPQPVTVPDPVHPSVAKRLPRIRARFTIRSIKWAWRHEQSFTCFSDPKGRGARRAAHDHARYLRSTYHCSFVAVVHSSRHPLPIAEGCE
jgi:hypothetical protein